MAFRRRAPIPAWRQKQIKEKEERRHEKQEGEMQEKVGGLFAIEDFSEEDFEAMRKCICPKPNCPTHPE